MTADESNKTLAEDTVALAIHPAWTVHRVDAPKRLAQMEDRSLALDTAGHPHIVRARHFRPVARLTALGNAALPVRQQDG